MSDPGLGLGIGLELGPGLGGTPVVSVLVSGSSGTKNEVLVSRDARNSRDKEREWDCE